MDRLGRLVAGVLLGAVLTPAGCGGQSQSPSPPQGQGPGRQKGADLPAADATDTTTEGGGAVGQKPAGPDQYSESAGNSAVPLVASVRAYVSAIDRRDGKALCSLLTPGALRGVRLPEHGSGCAGAVGASIGHSGRAAPAWRRTRIRRVGPVEIDPQQPGAARVRALVVHRFRGDREPSIEDDLIYLHYSAGRWLVAKPSSTFYRAIGARDVPLRAITPPSPPGDARGDRGAEAR